jgi:hypothetical protein
MTTEKKTVVPADEPFLSRWARVKQSSGAPVPGPNSSIGAPPGAEMPEDAHPEPTLPDEKAPAPLPPLDSLTPQSDYSPFMARDVDPQLRNLAMKKLFTDPHYNVMDRMDIYIDDYSTHAPLTEDIVRQMSISKAMRLFDDEDDAEKIEKSAAEAETVLEAAPAVAETSADANGDSPMPLAAAVGADVPETKKSA